MTIISYEKLELNAYICKNEMKQTCWSGPTPISTGGLAAISLKHENYPCLLMFWFTCNTTKLQFCKIEL